MSGRALRRLREEQLGGALDAANAGNENDNDSDESDDDDDDDVKPSGGGAFLAMMDDSSSSSSSSDSDEEDDDDDDDDDTDEKDQDALENTESQLEGITESDQPHKHVDEKDNNDNNDDDDEGTNETEEDLDAILAEFETKDRKEEEKTRSTPGVGKRLADDDYFRVLVDNFDVRNLDIDYVMRTNLMGGDDSRRPATRQANLFGPPREGWSRPPHYVGGGIGMGTYHDFFSQQTGTNRNNNNNNDNNNNNNDDDSDGDDNDRSSDYSIPWPYTKMEALQDLHRWYTFQQADTYNKDLEDYRRIQESGDANALALFVAHHPFVTEALLQLTMVLYQTNQSQDGLSLLRRTLWIYECASPVGFQPHKSACCFVNHDRPANQIFFTALFRLVQVSGMSGCIRTSLACSKYLLAMDPLRDPMGVLVILDYFALANVDTESYRFIKNLVESGKIVLWHKVKKDEYQSRLVDMPNWAYSYALALYHLEEQGEIASEEDIVNDNDGVRGDVDGDSDENGISTPARMSSKMALQDAIRKFPFMVERLLEKNDVNTTTARSFRTDWAITLPALRTKALESKPETTDLDELEMRASCTAVIDQITSVYCDRAYKLWSSSVVQTWLYGACRAVVESTNDEIRPVGVAMFPALLRYQRMDPQDYADRFRQLPPEANPLDPGLVAPALAVDPNRRRLLRGGGGAAGRQAAQQEMLAQFQRQQQQQNGIMIGGPPTHMIDPDSPMLEVFWRSMMPWNHVDGVPPPRR